MFIQNDESFVDYNIKELDAFSEIGKHILIWCENHKDVVRYDFMQEKLIYNKYKIGYYKINDLLWAFDELISKNVARTHNWKDFIVYPELVNFENGRK